MLNETMQQALNAQINLEFSAAHNYRAISAYFEALELTGFAHWFRIQSEEETSHAMRFFDYVNDRGGRVQLGAITEPQSEYGSPLDAFENALAHERKVTAAIHMVFAQAVQGNDYATQSMLKWFIDEQVEEEKNAEEVIQRLKLVGSDGTGLLMIDRELAGRTAGGAAPAAG